MMVQVEGAKKNDAGVVQGNHRVDISYTVEVFRSTDSTGNFASQQWGMAAKEAFHKHSIHSANMLN